MPRIIIPLCENSFSWAFHGKKGWVNEMNTVQNGVYGHTLDRYFR